MSQPGIKMFGIIISTYSHATITISSTCCNVGAPGEKNASHMRSSYDPILYDRFVPPIFSTYTDNVHNITFS